MAHLRRSCALFVRDVVTRKAHEVVAPKLVHASSERLYQATPISGVGTRQAG